MDGLKAVFSLSFRLLARSRKTLGMSMIVFLPVVVSFLSAVFAYLRVDAPGTTGYGLATMMMSTVYIHFALLAVCLFYATSLLGDEVEERTITYLFVRPVPRTMIYVGKYLACVLVASMLVLPSFVLSFSIVSALDPPEEVVRHLPALLKDLGILVLGILAYCGLFGFLGTTLKRPLLWGLVFAIGWEVIVTYIPGYIHRFTIAHYLQSLLPHASGQRGVLQIFGETTSTPVAILTLLIVAGTFVGLAAWTVSRKQYVLPA